MVTWAQKPASPTSSWYEKVMGFSLRWVKPPFLGRLVWLVSLASKPRAREIAEQKWTRDQPYSSNPCSFSPSFLKSLWDWDVCFKGWRTSSVGLGMEGREMTYLLIHLCPLLSAGKDSGCFVSLITCLLANTGLPLPPLTNCLHERYFEYTVLDIPPPPPSLFFS